MAILYIDMNPICLTACRVKFYVYDTDISEEQIHRFMTM